MKQIDIKNLSVEIDITKVLNAIILKKDLEIDISGNIYVDKKCDFKTALIYQLKSSHNLSTLLDINTLVLKLFKNFKPLVNGSKCVLKPLGAWQDVILLNQPRMLYYDHQTDGVELFEDKELEDIGWNAVACDITYREISEFIEDKCNGTLVFYDNEIQFNGFVIADDIVQIRKIVKYYIKRNINEKMKNDLIDIEDDDIIEALEFFEIKV